MFKIPSFGRRCDFESGHRALVQGQISRDRGFLSLCNTDIVVIFPNPCCWRRSLCSNLGGIVPEKPSRATLNKLAAGYSLKQCMGTIQQLGIGLQLIHNKIKLNAQTAWFISILGVLSTHVQYTTTDTIRQTDGPLVPMVRLVPIEKHPIPMVLLVNMHLI